MKLSKELEGEAVSAEPIEILQEFSRANSGAMQQLAAQMSVEN